MIDNILIIKGIYYREKLRKIVKEYNMFNYVAIDLNDYSNIPNLIGCFFKDNKWIVFKNDSLGDIILNKEFTFPEDAYLYVISKLGIYLVYEEVEKFKDFDKIDDRKLSLIKKFDI